MSESWSGTTANKTQIGCIPYDIAFSILEYFREDKRALSSCALVCRIWSDAARPHQYYRISCRTQKRLNELLQRLDEDRSTQAWIQVLSLQGDLYDCFNTMGRKLTRLRTIELTVVTGQQSLPHFLIEIPPVLCRENYLPALQTVTIKGERGMSILCRSTVYSMLCCFPRIQKLKVEGVNLVQSAADELQSDSEVLPELSIQSIVLHSRNPVSNEFYYKLITAVSPSALQYVDLTTDITMNGVQLVVRVLDVLITKLNLKPATNVRLNSCKRVFVSFRSSQPLLSLPLGPSALVALSNSECISNISSVCAEMSVPARDSNFWEQLDEFVTNRLPALTTFTVTRKRRGASITKPAEMCLVKLLFPRCCERRLLWVISEWGTYQVTD